MRDRVADQVRRAITRGELQPGERVVEWNIANELGVSRGPVREGLLELEREGLIRTYANRGAVVMDMTDSELLELLCPIRLTIERFASVATASNLQPETVTELETIVQQMQEAADENDTDRITDADLAFHRCIVSASGHAHALQIWNSIHPRIQAQLHRIGRGRRTSLDAIPGEHRILLDALLADDQDVLAETLEAHILHDTRRFLPARSDEQTPDA